MRLDGLDQEDLSTLRYITNAAAALPMALAPKLLKAFPTAKLYLMHRRNTQWRNYSRSLLEENKWRAVRYGADAKLIDFGRREERPFSELIVELVDFVEVGLPFYRLQLDTLVQRRKPIGPIDEFVLKFRKPG